MKLYSQLVNGRETFFLLDGKPPQGDRRPLGEDPVFLADLPEGFSSLVAAVEIFKRRRPALDVEMPNPAPIEGPDRAIEDVIADMVVEILHTKYGLALDSRLS